ncbi:hypothetical protein A2763_03555 [Candidatus Kaiserbacteria bacterium RIFCSPHIGHO2_01_FULL_54_36]|uniref:HTH arsR-type domain-containing protein n=1 Tax=Candidatus Kaiserbacteria bacterium RIFCSPHIGHO2_01_FULL_54_36 TaxID=1798482 RepID=A0A1F6CKZ3_9BACT|nr:MAG: hypothetical protein A2763_03555 [Candidatus Kaiserbacteria bacterium RIFCSPHIGHO2_01_FULL_54_36]
MAKDDFLGTLLDNKNRALLLRVFFLNSSEMMTLAQLAKRTGVQPRKVAQEVRKLEKLRIIKRGRATIVLANGSQREVQAKQSSPTWKVDESFRHYRALSVFIHEVAPVKFDSIVGMLRKTGKLSTVILSGNFMGDSSRPADLIVAADTVNERRLDSAIRAIEPTFGREIRYAAFSTPEFRYRLTVQDRLLRDTLDFPHLVLLDRTRLL